jgi:capsular polysaccharide biosynthesis protein
MGAVVTPDHSLISDVSHTGAGENPYSHPLFSVPRLPEVIRVKSRIAVVTVYPGNLPGRPYYGHWLLDMLPRFHLLEKSGIAWDQVVIPQVARYQRESLKLLGIDSIMADQNVNLQADELIVPSLAGFPIGNYSAWACQWLRDRFLPLTPSTSPSQPRKLYISRAKAATRRLLNESDLLSALSPLGFERVFLEDYSFLDGVRLMRDAEVVVSPHGSNIANLVFCRPGTPVIEIFSPKYVAACHYSAGCQAGLNYGYIIGMGKLSKHVRISENITVDPSHVLALLADMMPSLFSKARGRG